MIAVDRQGRIAVAFDIFKDKEFNGQVLFTRSEDGGRSFARPRPITADAESQRFQAVAFDPDGALFAAWLDKRNRAPARARGEKYSGAALAFAWSNDQGATFSETVSRRTTPANAVAWASLSPAPVAPSSCSATCLTVRCVITRS